MRGRTRQKNVFFKGKRKKKYLFQRQKKNLAQESFDLSSSRLWAWHANHCATELVIRIMVELKCGFIYQMFMILRIVNLMPFTAAFLGVDVAGRTMGRTCHRHQVTPWAAWWPALWALLKGLCHKNKGGHHWKLPPDCGPYCGLALRVRPRAGGDGDAAGAGAAGRGLLRHGLG